MKRFLSLFFLVVVTAWNSYAQTIPQIIESDLTLKLDNSPFTVDKSIVVSEGVKFEIEKGVVLNFTGADKYIDVRGTFKVNGGVTINMSGKGSYIKTEGLGKLLLDGDNSGTEPLDTIFITGENWAGIQAANSSQLRVVSVSVTGNDHHYWDWFVRLRDNSSMEFSTVSGVRNAVYLSESLLSFSKIYNISRHALELRDGSGAANTFIYDVNLTESNNWHVLVNNSSFDGNRIFQSENTSNNYAILAEGSSSINQNTIGGSNGLHGSVGIALRYGSNHKILNNNIGGYTSNLVIHGLKDLSKVYDNSFIGEMDVASGQRNVTVVNGQSFIEGYMQGGDSFNDAFLTVNLDFKNNYWGNTSDIIGSITDYQDAIERKGAIIFEPKLDSPRGETPPVAPTGLVKAVDPSGGVIIKWNAVDAPELVGYNIWIRDGDNYSYLESELVDETKDFYVKTLPSVNIDQNIAITSYNASAISSEYFGLVVTNRTDQFFGHESDFSDDFPKLQLTLNIQSDDALTTVGPVSSYDKWLMANYSGDEAVFNESTNRANEWNFETSSNARGYFGLEWNGNEDVSGLRVYYWDWHEHAIVEVNDLIKSLSTSRADGGSYEYIGQHNGHSYFRTSWNRGWDSQNSQAILDGGYLVVINDDSEADFLHSKRVRGWVGFYSEKAGTGYTMPGIWKWVPEQDPITGFDIRLPEDVVTATITATLDRPFIYDVDIDLITGGSTTIDNDFTLSPTSIKIGAGSTSATTTLETVQDNLDEADRDVVSIEVESSTYATASSDQKLMIAIEDDDEMPSVTLTGGVSEISASDAVTVDTDNNKFSENGGTAQIIANLSTASGRDVTIGLGISGTVGSSDFTAGGETIDFSDVLQDNLVLNYKFNGDADDASTYENDGNVFGAVPTTDRFGEENSAMQFDGEDDYISVPLSSSLQIEEDITISVWVNKEEANNWTDFVVRAPGEYYEMRIDQRDDNTAFEAYGRAAGSYDLIHGAGHIENGEWVMLTFSSTSNRDENGEVTSSKKFKFYVNGQLTNDFSRIGNRFDLNTNRNLMIGSNDNGSNNNFSGKMDELRIYDKALTDEEVQTLYLASSVQTIDAEIVILAGETTGELDIVGVDDETAEPEEILTASIINTVGATESGNQKVDLFIQDNDVTTVNLQVEGDIITEGTEEFSTITISLDKPSELPVTVNLTTAGVDASDFIIKSLPNFNKGENPLFLPSSWGNGEPNDAGGSEHYAHITGCDHYNDHQNTALRKHVLEVSNPYSETGDLSGYSYLADYNEHSYYLSDNNTSWTDAREQTEAIEDGYLIVIATEEELDFINDYTCDAWIGYYQDLTADDYSEPIGGWTWVNSNYNPEVSQVTIPAGETEAKVYVLALDDDIMGEGSESLVVSLGVIENGTAKDDSDVSVTIVDNDILPDVSIDISNQSISEGGDDFAQITATLSVATTQDVKVNLELSGTAQSNDFVQLNSTVKPPSQGLVAYYSFDGNADDQSGNDHNGSANNVTSEIDRHGVADGSYGFDGNSSYVEIPWSGNLKVQKDITISSWIKVKDKSEDGSVGSYGNIINTPGEYFQLYLNWNGGDGINNREIYSRSGGHGFEISQPITEDKWVNVVYTYTSGPSSDEDTLRVYADGALIRKEHRSWSWNNSVPGSGSVFIGTQSIGNNHFLGSIDDVRVYERALSDEEVSTLYGIENVAPVNGTITVSAGQTSKTIYIDAVDDDVYEGEENATMTVSSVENGNSPSSASNSVTFNIQDNDAVPTVSISSSTDFVGESDDFKEAVITATASSVSGNPIIVSLSFAGTGTKDDDYELSADSIIILPGETTGSVTLTAKWLSDNDPEEGEEDVVIAIESVEGANEDGEQSVTLKITENSCDNVEKVLKGNIREDITLLGICSPYTVGSTGFKVKEGYTLTIGKDAVLNFENDDAKITIEGTLIIEEGVTINMSRDSYILVEENGQLVINGTESNMVTIQGESWEKNTNNSNGPGIELNSTVASSIKYANIINSNVDNYEWMISIRDASTIENSNISGGKTGIGIWNEGSIINSKIHNFKRYTLVLGGRSTATGNEIYDTGFEEPNGNIVRLEGQNTFKNNRIYSSTNSTASIALAVDGDAVVENNTIGGSTGQHGHVGISIAYDRNASIKYNNIGGYLANVVVHGFGSGNQQNYVFTDNSFVGNLTGNQRHVVVYDGGNRTDWHTTNLPNYTRGGQEFDTERVNFENNYWGTTDKSVIDDAIQDSEDDLTFDVNGYIDFDPINTSASTSSPIASPNNLTKAVDPDTNDPVLTWDAVSVEDLNGYKIYKKNDDGSFEKIVELANDVNTYTGSDLGNFTDKFVITSFDVNANGVNDQNEGHESWFSFEFTPLSYTLSGSSSDQVTTIGPVSEFFTLWAVEENAGDSTQYYNNIERYGNWEGHGYSDKHFPVALLQNTCKTGCQDAYYGAHLVFIDWHNHALVEVNSLITSLSTSRPSGGSYQYLGQYNGHSYFRTSWSDNWTVLRDQANADGGYLVMINNQEEFDYMDENFNRPNGFIGLYATEDAPASEQFGDLPGVWTWAAEQEPETGFDIRLPESAAQATITATLDRAYGDDVNITLFASGTATTADFELSPSLITIPAGTLSGSTTLSTIEDILDENDRDTLLISVENATYATERTDQTLKIAIEDNDDLPSVTLSAAADSIIENSGSTTLTAKLSEVSGREVEIGIMVEGDAGSNDFTVDNRNIEKIEVLPAGLVANYTFEGNALDKTDFANHGTVNGARLTADRFGEEASAYYFDGSDNITVPATNSLLPEDELTINAWLKFEDTDNHHGYIVDINNSMFYTIRTDRRGDNSISFRGKHHSHNYSDDPPEISHGQWTMITMTSKYNGDAEDPKMEINLYVDGELKITSSTSRRDYNNDVSNMLVIGSAHWNNEYFKGSIDDLRIYAKALSVQDVGVLYSRTKAQDVDVTITIPAGETTSSVTVAAVDDVVDEFDESVSFKVVSTDAAIEDGDQVAELIIEDDDVTKVNLSITTEPLKEGDNTPATITATINNISEKVVEVPLFGSGTGIDPTDFRFSEDDGTGSEVATATLVAQYKFDGDAEDGSGNGINGFNNGAIPTTDRFGNENSAFLFDGSGARVEVPYTGAIQFEGPMSISMWVNKIDNGSGYTSYIISGPNGYFGVWSDERDNGTKHEFRGRASGFGHDIGTNQSTPLNTWVMYTLVADTISQTTVIDTATQEQITTKKYVYTTYINGQFAETKDVNNSNWDFPSQSDHIFAIGSNYNGNEPFIGKLDDIRFYKGALSEEEIKILYEREGYATGNSIIISPGTTSGNYYVFPEDDTDFNEGDETLQISAGEITNGVIGESSVVSILIQDNDVSPDVSVEKIKGFEITEGGGENDYIEMKAKLSEVTTVDVSLVLTAKEDNESGSAADKSDFFVSDNILSDNQISAANLVAHYKFSGNANDESGNGNNAEYVKADFINDRFGNPESALQFNGNDQFVAIPFDGSLKTTTGDMTMSVWAYVEDVPDQNPMILHAQNHYYGLGVVAHYNDPVYGDVGEFSWFGYSPGSYNGIFVDCCHYQSEYGKHRAPQKKWVMITYTLTTTQTAVDSTSTEEPENVITVRGYYDGKLAHTTTSEYYYEDVPAEGYLTIAGEGGPNRNFKGRLDDIRIYNGALSSNEILNLYRSESEGIEVDNNAILVPAGEVEKTFYIYAADDKVKNEGTESLDLEIESVAFGQVGTSASIQVDINDNDIFPTVSLSASNNTTPLVEGGDEFVTINVDLDQTTTHDVEVSLEMMSLDEDDVTLLINPASVDDFAISDENEIDNLVTLAAAYDFFNADPNSSVIVDVSGNGNDGKLNGGAEYKLFNPIPDGDEEDGLSQNDTVPVQQLKALYFDGVDDNIVIPFDGSLMIEGDISINILMNVTSDDSQFHRDIIQTPDNYYHWKLNSYLNGSETEFSVGAIGGGLKDLTDISRDNEGNQLEVGQFYNITYTLGKLSAVNPSTDDLEESWVANMYLDGALVKTKYLSSDNSIDMPTVGDLVIGGTSDHFQGYIGDIRIYDGVLTQEDIVDVINDLRRTIAGTGDPSSSSSIAYKVTVPAGETRASVYVLANDDDVFNEPLEFLTLEMNNVVDAIKSEVSTSVDIIFQDNDIKPSVSVSLADSNSEKKISESKPDTPLELNVNLDNVTTVDVTVDFDVSSTDYIISDKLNDGSDSAQYIAKLVGHYPFDGDANDVSGVGNNGIVNGNASLTTDRFGNENSAFLFDGNIGSNIKIPYQGDLNVEGDMTISIWVNKLNNGNNYRSYILRSPGDYFGIWTDKRAGGAKYEFRARASGFGHETGTNQETPLNEWVMFTITAQTSYTSQLIDENTGEEIFIESTFYNTYINGVLSETRYVDNLNFNRDFGDIILGSSYNEEPFIGKLDDLRFYKGALSDEDVLELYMSNANASGDVVSGGITVPAGETSTNFYVYPVDDNIFEGLEEFDLVATDIHYGNKLTEPGSVMLKEFSIEDNDVAPEISLSVSNSFLGEVSGFNTLDIVAQIESPASTEINIPILISGTVSASDYTVNPIITIPAGETEGMTQLVTIDDGDNEDDESLVIRFDLTGQVNVSDEDNSNETVMITDDVCEFIETELSGNIFEDLTLYKTCEPYYITGDLFVGNNATLTIQPGVNILIEGPYKIEVDNGRLISIGSKGDSITFSGITWQGIDIKSSGSMIQYTKIIDEGNSGQGDFILKLTGSHIDKSHVTGSLNGILLRDESIVSRSRINDIRTTALRLYESFAVANDIYDIGADLFTDASIKLSDGSVLAYNRIYSTIDNPNMIAVGVEDYDSENPSEVSMNTIGSDKGLQGKIGIFINRGNESDIYSNRIGGFKTNIAVIGSRPLVGGNTFMGELDTANAFMNVRVASDRMEESNQGNPGYLLDNLYGFSYNSDKVVVDFTRNYFENIPADKIAKTIYDYDDRADLRGSINYSDSLDRPNEDTPLTPPRNVTKSLLNNGSILLEWSINPEDDVLGYHIYHRIENGGQIERIAVTGNFKNSDDGVATYELISSGQTSIQDDYFVTAYNSEANDAGAGKVFYAKDDIDNIFSAPGDEAFNFDDQYEGTESWMSEPAMLVEKTISVDVDAISEDIKFNRATITVGLTSTSPRNVDVELVVDPASSATDGEDFIITPSKLVINSGELSADAVLTAVRDSIDESDETVSVFVKGDVNKVANLTITENICNFIDKSISGTITENLTLFRECSPYIVSGNVVVGEGVTLFIESGVELKFNPNTYLRVNGQLVAEGTPTDSIHFTGNNWKYIDIVSKRSDSRISFANISDSGEGGMDWDYKVKLRNSILSNSVIENVMNGVELRDSSVVEYSVIRELYGHAINSSQSGVYGNVIERAWKVPGWQGVKPTVFLHNQSVFRNNIVRNIEGATAIEAHGETIIEQNILGDYSGRHGTIGLLVNLGNNHTIRNNKIGGFTANVVLIGTTPTFSRNSFIGSSDNEFNVVVGSGNININDSVRYDIGVNGDSYNEENVKINMRSNYWGAAQSENDISASIFDYVDNFDVRGEIVFSDNLSIPDDKTPISPPVNLKVTETSLNTYELSWDPNIESDVNGYVLYSGESTVTNISGLDETEAEVQIDDVNNFNVELTAIDNDYENDLSRLINTVRGHQSLPTTTYTISTLPRGVEDNLRVPRNSSIVISTYPEETSILAGFEFKNSYNSTYGTYQLIPGTSEYQTEISIEFDKDRFETENNAVHFDNESNLRVDHDELLNLNTDNSFAVSLWFKLDSVSLNKKSVLIHKGGHVGWDIEHDPQFGVRLRYNFNDFYGSQRIYDTLWHHVAFTYQKTPVFGTSRSVMYLDGVRVMEDDRELTQTQSESDLYIGNSPDSPWDGLFGSIDDILIYNTALSEEQITEIYNVAKTENILANDIDLDGDNLVAELVSGVSNGELTLQTNGDVEYTPTTDYSGSDSFTYRVRDENDNVSNATTVNISISTPPTAGDDTYQIDEDITLVVSEADGLLGNDIDGEGDVLSVIQVVDDKYHSDKSFTNWDDSQPDNSDNEDFAVVNNKGFWDDRGYNDQFRFVVEFNEIRNSTNDPNLQYLGKWNGHSYFISNTFLNWDNANLVAKAAGGYLFIPNSYAENIFVSNISYNSEYWIGYYQDKDADNYEEPLDGWLWVDDGILPTGTEIEGVLDINPDGSFTYEPSANFNGVNTLKYRAFDGVQFSDVATVTITVNPVDDAPVGNDDFYTVSEDDTLSADNISIVVPDVGKVAEYKFDGSTDDAGPNNIPLTIYGSPTPTKDRFGRLNSAYYFDGERDFMIGNASNFPSGNESFTISLWFNSDDIGSNNGNARQLFGYGGPSLSMLFDNPALPSSNSFEVSGGQFSLNENYRFRSKYVYDSETINNKWHNLIITYSEPDASTGSVGTLTIYYDGKTLGGNPIGDMNTQTFDKVFSIGAHTNQNGDYVYTYPLYKYFKGSIDDVIVYDRVLNSEEIISLSSTTFTSLLSNDVEVDGEDMSISDQAISDAKPQNGTLTLNSDGTFTYLPNVNYYGPDTFTYFSTDTAGNNSESTTVRITVLPVDDVPLANDDIYNFMEDSAYYVNLDDGILSNDQDVDGDKLTATLINDVENGTLSLNDDGTFTYKPIANYNGEDKFTYTVSDGKNITEITDVVINIEAVDDRPVAQNDTFFLEVNTVLAVLELDSASEGYQSSVLSNDSDVDGDTLTATLFKDVENGTLSLNDDGTFTYEPNADYAGVDGFTYITQDGNITEGVSPSVANVLINVTNRPVAVSDFYSVSEDNCLNVGVPVFEFTQPFVYSEDGLLSNDLDPDLNDELTAVLVTDVSNGTLQLFEDGTFVYCPNANFNGQDKFTYYVTDGFLNSIPVIVSIEIVSVRDLPVPNDDNYGVAQGDTLVVDVENGFLSNDFEYDGNFLGFFTGQGIKATSQAIPGVGGQPGSQKYETDNGGEMVIYTDGSFEYKNDTDFSGTDKFEYYLASIDAVDSVILDLSLSGGEVTIDVTRKPTGTEDIYEVSEDNDLFVQAQNGVLANDNDPDGDKLTSEVTQTTTYGTLTLYPNGGFDYIPNIDFFGTDNFTYIASDGYSVSSEVSVTITVKSENDLPKGVDDQFTVEEGNTYTNADSLSLLANDTDVETSNADLSITEITTNPQFGTVDLVGDEDSVLRGDFVYVHDGSNSTTDRFEYALSDGEGGVDTVAVTVNILPVDDLPLITPSQLLLVKEDAVLNTLVGKVRVEDENLQENLSGTFNITTTLMNDDYTSLDSLSSGMREGCLVDRFNGTVEISSVSENDYSVNVSSDDGKAIGNDFAFGAYYACNGQVISTDGDLRIRLDENGLSFVGKSKTNSEYTLIDYKTTEYFIANIGGGQTKVNTLDLLWNGDGVTGYTALFRYDGVDWKSIISGENTGFTWLISDGPLASTTDPSVDSLFKIDNLGNVFLNAEGVLNYEGDTRNYSIKLLANDGTTNDINTQEPADVTISVANVWDMKVVSESVTPAFCGLGSITVEVSEFDGNGNDLTATWSDGTTGNFDENGVYVRNDMTPGEYDLTITNIVDGVNRTIKRSYVISSESVYSGADICYVTAGDGSEINGVVAERDMNVIFIDEGSNPYNIESFIILREGIVAGVYDSIGAIYTDSLEAGFQAAFVDTEFDNKTTAARYKVRVRDLCGNESPESTQPHITNHLTANQGINGEINLIWSGYEGIPVPTYDIYRKSSADTTFEVYAQVSSNNLSYTDLAENIDPALSYDYFIGYNPGEDLSCVNDGGGIAIEHHDFDDIENVFIPNSIIESGNVINVDQTFGSSYITNTTGLKGRPVIRSSPFQLAAQPPAPLVVEPIIIESVDKIYPNPANQMIYIDLNDGAGDIERLYFVDFSGKLIDNVPFKQTGDKAVVDIDLLKSGIYLLDVSTKTGHSRVKVVIQK